MINVQLESAAMWETIEDALKAAIMAQRGYKVVGNQLWPSLPPESASRKLAHCVDASRAERLTPSEVIFVLRAAREIGYHEPMNFFAADVGYKAEPVTAEEEVADIFDDMRLMLSKQAEYASRIERAAKRMQSGSGARKGGA